MEISQYQITKLFSHALDTDLIPEEILLLSCKRKIDFWHPKNSLILADLGGEIWPKPRGVVDLRTGNSLDNPNTPVRVHIG